MKSRSILVAVMVCVILLANIASADTFGTGSNQFTIDFVNITENASSANGTNISQYLPGHPDYKTFTDPGGYRMGTYEITNDQWNKFTNIYGTPAGSPWTAYDRIPYHTDTNVPTNNTSWYEAAQFVNWLNTSTGHHAAYKFTDPEGIGNYILGVWESGDVGYDSSNPYRNSEAFYFLPTEDEWVKAAYWNGTALQMYANASASDLISGVPDPAKWNYVSSAGNSPWNVGSGPEELNGTFDMMGNIFEWMESPWDSGDYLPGSFRDIRGGSYGDSGLCLMLSYRYDGFPPSAELYGIGFRVASVPTPPSQILTVQVEPNDLGIDTTDPNIGDNSCYINSTVNLKATRFIDCPDVYQFDYWVGDVNDVNDPNTTVFMDSDKTVTAVFMATRECGDECHPSFTLGDLNHDCIIDFKDIAMVTSRWLDCMKPECD